MVIHKHTKKPSNSTTPPNETSVPDLGFGVGGCCVARGAAFGTRLMGGRPATVPPAMLLLLCLAGVGGLRGDGAIGTVAGLSAGQYARSRTASTHGSPSGESQSAVAVTNMIFV